ncbi:MAG: AMP-binding protein [Bacteroidetes bacterium]|nr:AMP-binding protein [Bacteroidota bacterium]
MLRGLQNERGTAPGARVVAWPGFNTPELVAMLFACARTGLVMLPLSWRLSDEELAAIVADAGSFGAGGGRPQLRRVALNAGRRARCSPRANGARAFRLPNEDGDPRFAASSFAAPERGVLLIYTSGTTGRARALLYTGCAVLQCA